MGFVLLIVQNVPGPPWPSFIPSNPQRQDFPALLMWMIRHESISLFCRLKFSSRSFAALPRLSHFLSTTVNCFFATAISTSTLSYCCVCFHYRYYSTTTATPAGMACIIFSLATRGTPTCLSRLEHLLLTVPRFSSCVLNFIRSKVSSPILLLLLLLLFLRILLP